MPIETLSATRAFRADIGRRLRCAEGHLRGIGAMVEGGADCESLVGQTHAVQAALAQINRLILTHHLDTCVREALNGANSTASENCLAEVVSLYQLLGTPISEKESV